MFAAPDTQIYLQAPSNPPGVKLVVEPSAAPRRSFQPAVRAMAVALLVPALWLIVAPQARSGLPALRWLARSAFPGEAPLGALLLVVSLAGLFGGETGE